jgi:Kdo2-lipid IVA lauroyltransferase/acyltransferase
MTAWLTGRVASLSTQCGFTIGCVAVRVLPRRWLFGLADLLANVGFSLFRGFRSRSTNNIAMALGNQLNAAAMANTARRSLRNFFRDCVEIGVTLESSDDELQAQVPIVGKEHLDAALNKGKGVIVLSAHLGNFFILGTRLAVEGYPNYVLVNQPRDGRFAELMDKYRLKVKQQTIHARPRREALRKLNEVLRDNGIATIIADEYRQSSGVRVPLFGRMVIARRGPATLALRTGAAVVPACVVRQPDDTLRLIIERELELDRTGKTMADVKENTIRITQWLERTVRKYPDQWNWMNIRWWANSFDPPIAKGQQVQRAS